MRVCAHDCGASLRSQVSRNCPHCGIENSSEAKFCDKCGFSLNILNFKKRLCLIDI